ncbi:hypothetical protein SERLA73DRAFT_162091 [Serpula lacrymans var. lacrymans S7.3]|uniref:DUF6534 domain-containing protein n=2 Tax=Serpula lacrymans var. lacrymans TaxID=341189 RepID=F8Q6E8_SERL3|nr:uncharacterized protein SERLADRAFT_474523 [Serpula lacrymans var. lacrymans S7.9]EGN96186.1 hypothetical protein SERLA73DRAFT_162091 [Serpula lacrymans var. lacrymans S7.3]EGO21728.1 hypothetical protein SERLADRAFT_474523 [Serpula lacrymans var. lacrymans S7.9]
MNGFNVPLFFGAMYWGFIFSTALVGISIVQGYIYFTNNSRDPWTIKALVILLLILDPAGSVLIGETMYFYFLVNFGNVMAFARIPTSWCVETFVTAFVTCVTQLYFATRLYKIYKQSLVLPRYSAVWLVPAVVAFFAVFGLASGTLRAVWLVIWTTQRFSSTPVQVAVGAEEGCAVVADLITTIALCHILSPARTGVRRSGSSRIKTLFIFLVNRGILVTFVQLGMLIAYLCAATDLYWMPFHLCKSKLYTNTLLAMLNSRESGRTWLNNTQGETSKFHASVVQTPVFNITVNGDTSVSTAGASSTVTEKDDTPEIMLDSGIRTAAREGSQNEVEAV